MRVLVASDTPFLPPTAGNRRRIHEMIGFLAGAGVEVGVVMLPAADRHEWDEAGVRGGGGRVRGGGRGGDGAERGALRGGRAPACREGARAPPVRGAHGGRPRAAPRRRRLV